MENNTARLLSELLGAISRGESIVARDFAVSLYRKARVAETSAPVAALANPVAALQHSDLAFVFVHANEPRIAAYHARRAVSFIQGSAR